MTVGGLESTRAIRSRLGCSGSRLKLFRSRLGNCSKFELKLPSRLGVDSSWPGVDSPTSGADLAILESAHPLKSVDPILNFVHSSRLDCPWSRLESQSPNSRFSVFWLIQSWSRLELPWSRLGSQFVKHNLLPSWCSAALESTRAVWESTRISETANWSSVFFGVAVSLSRLVQCGSRLESQSPKNALWLFPCVPLRVDSCFLRSRPTNHRSRLAFHWSRLESQTRKLLSDFSACDS